jgi:integrase/recombinase XerD
MHFVEHRVPGALEQINRVLAIPQHKTDIRLVDHLSAEQCQAILENPAPTTQLAIRDRAMLHVSIAAGLRVSELVGLRLDDVSFESQYLNLHVRGKGRKHRLLTLWRPVAESVRAWISVRGEARVPELFLNARGKEMTRAGFEYLLRKHATAASQCCPSLRDKRISPHVLRHYLPFLTMLSNAKNFTDIPGNSRACRPSLLLGSRHSFPRLETVEKVQ